MNRELLEEYKKKNELIMLSSLGDSMLPFISSGCNLLIRCCHSNTVLPGDIIVFFSESGLACHRCIRVSDGIILERGDNCVLFSKLRNVFCKDIIGIVVAFCKEDREITKVDSYPYYRKSQVLVGKISDLLSFGCRKGDQPMSSTCFGNIISCLIKMIYGIEKKRRSRYCG